MLGWVTYTRGFVSGHVCKVVRRPCGAKESVVCGGVGPVEVRVVGTHIESIKSSEYGIPVSRVRSSVAVDNPVDIRKAFVS